MTRACPLCGIHVPYDVMKQQRRCPRCRREASDEEVENASTRLRDALTFSGEIRQDLLDDD